MHWNFPPEIQNALRWFVDPLNPAAGLLAAVVHLSTQIAHGLQNGETPEQIAAALDEAVLARLSLERADALWRIESCKDLPAATEQLM
jgi:hypothetical protein